jgi:hypothetical protein
MQHQVHDVVGQRSADQEFHRQVIDALGVLPIIGGLGLDPALREDVAHRAGHGLEALSLVGTRRVDHGVRQQVALNQCIGSSREGDGTEIVRLELLRHRAAAD